MVDVTHAAMNDDQATQMGSADRIALSSSQEKDIRDTHRTYTASEIMERVAEFFSELPAIASANIRVSWANLKNHGYAIITQILKYAEISKLMLNPTRENIEKLRVEHGITMPGPSAG
jgi:hypothetical protein